MGVLIEFRVVQLQRERGIKAEKNRDYINNSQAEGRGDAERV